MVSPLFLLMIVSCNIFGRLNSVTSIQPKDIFILGNNEHGSFRVELKNISSGDLEIFLTPLGGGKHSYQIIKPSQSIKIKVDKNTALNISNSTEKIADVNLKVTGDTGLSMGYKN